MNLKLSYTQAIGLGLSCLLVSMPGTVNAGSIEVVEAPLPGYSKKAKAMILKRGAKVNGHVVIQGSLTNAGTVNSYELKEVEGPAFGGFGQSAIRAFRQTTFSGDVGPDVLVTIKYEWDSDKVKSRIVSITSEQVDVSYTPVAEPAPAPAPPPPKLTLVSVTLPGPDSPFTGPMFGIFAELQSDGSYRGIRVSDFTTDAIPYTEGQNTVHDALVGVLRSMEFSGAMAQPLSVRVIFGFLHNRGVYLSSVQPFTAHGVDGTEYQRKASIDWSEFEPDKVYP